MTPPASSATTPLYLHPFLMQQRSPFSPYQPQLGCFLLLAVLMLTCLMPLFLVEAAQVALAKLHLGPTTAVVVLVGILLGGLVNLPLFILQRQHEQPFPENSIYSLMGWVPVFPRQPMRTIVAVNVGGCLIPAGLALFETALITNASPEAARALVVAAAINIGVCYFAARPVPGIGIAMPAFTSPLVSVLTTWVLLMPDEYAMVRAPVAFVAGVLGPLIGADLLHLRDITKIAAPVVSIGGAGTFDGIVLSGLLAALLA